MNCLLENHTPRKKQQILTQNDWTLVFVPDTPMELPVSMCLDGSLRPVLVRVVDE